MVFAQNTTEPGLPTAQGPLSAAVKRCLCGPAPIDQLARIGGSVGDCDAYGLDVQLALHMCYELHYRGFAGDLTISGGVDRRQQETECAGQKTSNTLRANEIQRMSD